MRDGWHLDDRVVAQVAEAFGLGSVQAVSYLATGLMNRNWRITAGSGQFVLKQTSCPRTTAHTRAAPT